VIEYLDLLDLAISVKMPDAANPEGVVSGMLTYKGSTVGGGDGRNSVNLFPGTVEIIVAPGKRLLINNTDGTLNTTWVGVGMDTSGNARELGGLKELSVLITPPILDAKVKWTEDDRVEGIFFESEVVN
jgi:hypothetical protein